MTLLESLNQTTHRLRNHRIENPRLSAELLLARSLNLSREGLYRHLPEPVKEPEKEVLEGLIQRRISGEPLQYILGLQEFWSIDFKVDPRVLIPRPETELLIEQSLPILSERSLKRNSSVLEIGTGSGAIAIALTKEVKNIFLIATDISREALVLARENAKSAGVQDRIQFLNGDLFGPLHPPKGEAPFDLILSNPPYITRPKIDTLAKEVKDYEPRIALDGGDDGLAFYRRIIPEASLYLRKGGWLLLEVALGQSGIVSKMIEEGGNFLKPESIPDLSGIGRVVKAQKSESRK
ncbi:MAG TPA: peptide chain release factor N(5)-glutamine methyltransferase [Thermodesulfobacteriota bacterium]|nr:peptide chain release factor N(5)-glutamine methyltransferase [Thermodesulfobacteriota bacterium]